MRIAFIIFSLTAIAVGLVHIRTAENACRNQVLTLQNYYRVEVPRKLWDQQVELSHLTAPVAVQKRAEELALQLVEKDKRTRLASGEPTENAKTRR